MSLIVKSMDSLIGNTPILELEKTKNYYSLSANIFAKLECFNPGGSIKDRVAKNMLDDAEKNGIINKDTVIIEPTSGNTGIGLAAVAAMRGYRCIIVMPDTMSMERRMLVKAYGAELVLTDGNLGMQGSIDKAKEMSTEIPNSFIAGQFVNKANPEAHYNTTGPEIYNQLEENIDIFVCCVGTGGTITGTGRYLKSKNKDIKIVAVEPENSAVLSGKQPGKHKIQGIGAGFVPDILNTDIYDSIECVSDEDAINTCVEFSKTEGLLVGISSGAALNVAIRLAKLPENINKNIVVILPDTGERYLSTGIYD